jgi:hypothetical protein
MEQSLNVFVVVPADGSGMEMRMQTSIPVTPLHAVLKSAFAAVTWAAESI